MELEGGEGTNEDSVEEQIHPPVKGEDRSESGRSLEHGIRGGGLESESESGRSGGDGIDWKEGEGDEVSVECPATRRTGREREERRLTEESGDRVEGVDGVSISILKGESDDWGKEIR